jgi:hypothetical protein
VTKKFHGIPVWVIAVVLAGGGYLFYRIHKEREEEPTGEGLYPTTGLERPEAPSEGASAPAAGIAQLGEEIQSLAAAGFVPAGSEEAKSEPGFAPPNRFESLIEEGFGSYLEHLINPTAAEHPGKAQKGAKGKKAGNNPKHLQTPGHNAAKHPKQRIGIGEAKIAGRAGNPKSAKNQKAVSHVGHPGGGAHPGGTGHKNPRPKPPRPKKSPRPQKAHH